MRAGFLDPLVQHPRDAFALQNIETGGIVAAKLEAAFDSPARRRGLLGRTSLEPDVAFVIAPSNAVHTFFMKFPIDIIFVRRDGRVTNVRPAVAAWRLALSPWAFAVIEMAVGGADGVRVGDRLQVVPGESRDARTIVCPAEDLDRRETFTVRAGGPSESPFSLL
jgi:uncharacterized protein